MDSYERVRAAVHHIEPDHVPCDFDAEQEVIEKLSAFFGVSSLNQLRKVLRIDRRTVEPRYIGPSLKAFEDGSYEGIVSGGPVYRNIPAAAGGTTNTIIHFPWSDVESSIDLEGRYGWDGDIAWWDFSAVKEQIDELERDDHYWIAAHGDPSGLQHLCIWTGDEKFLTTLALDEELTIAMIEKHNHFRLEHALRTLEAGGGRIHELHGGGDYGAQSGLLISKQMFRHYFKKLYVDFYKEIRKNFDVEIFFHSCGSVSELIPELVDAGVTILDPIQTSAKNMEIEKLKAQFGDKLCFHGAIDIQSLLPYESEQTVRAEVRRTISVLGKDGGYILAPTHSIQSDTPLENIIAMYEEAQGKRIGGLQI